MKTNIKQTIIWLVVVVVVGAGSFYGGMKYGQSGSTFQAAGFGNFQNMTDQQRQDLFSQNRGTNSTGRTGGTMARGSQMINGDIISKDDDSLTVSLPDGGSKIIFFSGSTTVGKFTEATVADLVVGETVIINGSNNDDGSVSAQMIQVRPEGTTPVGGPGGPDVPVENN